MEISPEFVKLFDANQWHIYRAIRRKGMNHLEAQEAVSQTFINLSKMQDTIVYADEKKVRSLFIKAGVNCAIDMFRSTSQDVERLKGWFAEKSNILETRKSIDHILGVHHALSKLPEQDRWLAWRYWALEYSLQEIVEDLASRGVEWSRQYLHKYLRKVVRPSLKAELSKEGFK